MGGGAELWIVRNFPKQILVLGKEKIDLSKESFYPLRPEFSKQIT